MRTSVLAFTFFMGASVGISVYGRENPQLVPDTPRIQELGTSAAREHRIYAADWLGEETQQELRKAGTTAVLEKLLSDEDTEVASRAALAVQSQANRATFDVETASKFVSFLRAQLPKERIDAAFTPQSTEDASRLVVCRVMASNALYRHHPLISIAEYARWQEDVLRSLVGRMALHRPALSKATDAYTEFLLHEMDVSGPLLEATQLVTESLDRVPPEQVTAIVGRLLVHPLFQDDGPLSPLLIELLRQQRAILQTAASLEAQQVEDPAKRILPALLRRMGTSPQQMR